MAYPRLELIHWKRGLLLNVLKREEAWFVFSGYVMVDGVPFCPSLGEG